MTAVANIIMTNIPIHVGAVAIFVSIEFVELYADECNTCVDVLFNWQSLDVEFQYPVQ